MTTATIPLGIQDMQTLDYLLNIRQVASNKAEIFRIALRKLAEDEAVSAVLEGERELKEGKGLRGDIRVLAKQLKF